MTTAILDAEPRTAGGRGDVHLRTQWIIPPDFSGSYGLDETGQHVRSIERVVIRSNGSPYRVRPCLLKPMLHKQSGLWYVRLATGRRGRYYTLYQNRRTLEQKRRHQTRGGGLPSLVLRAWNLQSAIRTLKIRAAGGSAKQEQTTGQT